MKSILFSFVIASIVIASCNGNSSDDTVKLDTAAAKTDVAVSPPVADSTKLNGNWTLTRLTGIPGSCDSLYSKKTPYILFDLATRRVSGNTGCNNFAGELDAVGSRISFVKPMVMTKMFCQGDAEPVFLQNLQKVTSYMVKNDSTLTFLADEVEIMQFVKSPDIPNKN